MERLVQYALHSGDADRYLWTDALAVLGLVHAGRGAEARRLCDRTVERLGCGQRYERGLRIGKPRPERAASEPYVAHEEWDRDGQYFHYLTKWAWAMHELGENESAREMLAYATQKFAAPTGKLCWKMSVDLSRPLVESTGQHDALDGFITMLQLGADRDTDPAVKILRKQLRSAKLSTMDELGIGGLLMDAARTVDLGDAALHAKVLSAAKNCSTMYYNVKANEALTRPAEERLAFRELGVAIGAAMCKAKGIEVPAAESLAKTINDFWAQEANRDNALYREHLNINEVMRACAIVFSQ